MCAVDQHLGCDWKALIDQDGHVDDLLRQAVDKRSSRRLSRNLDVPVAPSEDAARRTSLKSLVHRRMVFSKAVGDAERASSQAASDEPLAGDPTDIHEGERNWKCEAGTKLTSGPQSPFFPPQSAQAPSRCPSPKESEARAPSTRLSESQASSVRPLPLWERYHRPPPRPRPPFGSYLRMTRGISWETPVVGSHDLRPMVASPAKQQLHVPRFSTPKRRSGPGPGHYSLPVVRLHTATRVFDRSQRF